MLGKFPALRSVCSLWLIASAGPGVNLNLYRPSTFGLNPLFTSLSARERLRASGSGTKRPWPDISHVHTAMEKEPSGQPPLSSFGTGKELLWYQGVARIVPVPGGASRLSHYCESL